MQWREAILLAYSFNKTNSTFKFIANQFVIPRLKGINGIMRKKIINAKHAKASQRAQRGHKRRLRLGKYSNEKRLN